MSKEEHLQSIKEIKEMMTKSSKFMSLNGWAGILSGIYACVAAFASFAHLDYNLKPRYFSTDDDIVFGIIGLVTLVLALVTGIISSKLKAKKHGYLVWDSTAKQGLLYLSVPLLTGFIFCAFLMKNDLESLIASSTLIFYGLGLFSVSHFTFKEVKHLGFIQLTLGLISLFFIEYGLIFWTLGFGIAHILYGIIVKRTYK